ncbi:MAG: aminotransferase class IV [Myxococcota bacterium]|nr:aminotransferase class IV [Myxococcota bacterium]
MERGTHAHTVDERNASVLVYLNGELVPREQAMVSVMDAGFILGDGVWEGMRIYGGRVAFIDQHLDRLMEGAKAIDLDIGMARSELTDAIYKTVEANEMRDGVHLRLMVTRGVKSTPFQGTNACVGRPTVVITAEYKEVSPEVVARGLDLFTVHVRRGRPDVQDPTWNSHSKLNCISAWIQANKAGADEGLMLDPHGFVATCNSTHFFIVRGEELWTSSGRYCLHGITRANILRVAQEAGMITKETDFSLTKVYSADEAFCTGTFAGVIPVRGVDGREIGTQTPGRVTTRLASLYKDLILRTCS